MASFKLCISDPSSGRSFQKEVKDNMARPFIGLNIGESIQGDNFELNGYEFQITGGSDFCGFPMRRGILGARKKITLYGGVGFKGDEKGIKRRKTVCGHKIHDKISQVNLKVTKQGPKKLNEIFGVPEKEESKEAKPQAKELKAEAKDAKVEVKPEAKEHKAEAKEVKAEAKPEAKKEEHKKEEPKHVKSEK